MKTYLVPQKRYQNVNNNLIIRLKYGAPRNLTTLIAYN